ncbi:hypothetical protein F5Y02DRAFT_412647 [Annulohypoxylon stygium]|nr:hypothetical protein F5Y02DRAFT_412647 [Annulohypoxylon stygium]
MAQNSGLMDTTMNAQLSSLLTRLREMVTMSWQTILLLLILVLLMFLTSVVLEIYANLVVLVSCVLPDNSLHLRYAGDDVLIARRQDWVRISARWAWREDADASQPQQETPADD